MGYAAVWIGKLSWRLYNPIAEIVNLCVSPAFRGSGVGTALMGEIAHIAQARGVKRLQVTALSQNDPALHFYRKHGFSDVDIILEKDIL